MKNHYIPQFVLNEFVDSELNTIHVYDKGRDLFYQSSPADLFAIRDFYDEQTEMKLGGLEGEIAPVLQCLLRSCRNGTTPSIASDQILGCCRALVLLQFRRTPWAKELSTRYIDKRRRGELEMAEILSSHGLEPNEENLSTAQMAEAHYVQDARKPRRSEIWSKSLVDAIDQTGLAMPGVSGAALNKGVVVVKSESAFVLGDRGALSTATADKPLSHPEREVFFPVSPDIALSIAGEQDQVRYVDVSKGQTRSVNLSTVRCCDRIASHSSRLLQSLANPR